MKIKSLLSFFLRKAMPSEPVLFICKYFSCFHKDWDSDSLIQKLFCNITHLKGDRIKYDIYKWSLYKVSNTAPHIGVSFKTTNFSISTCFVD